MPRKPKPSPKCCAPMCQEDAWHRVDASGDHGIFQGDLCDKHYVCFQACFPASYSSVAFLKIITREDLDAALAAQNL